MVEIADKIKTLLSEHDWNYDYADDYRIWSKGHSQHCFLLQLMRTIPVCELPELLKSVPEHHREKWILDLNLMHEK